MRNGSLPRLGKDNNPPNYKSLVSEYSSFLSTSKDKNQRFGTNNHMTQRMKQAPNRGQNSSALQGKVNRSPDLSLEHAFTSQSKSPQNHQHGKSFLFGKFADSVMQVGDQKRELGTGGQSQVLFPTLNQDGD